MAEVGFYHLLTMPLDRALPKLLERAVAGGERVVVIAGSRGARRASQRSALDL